MVNTNNFCYYQTNQKILISQVFFIWPIKIYDFFLLTAQDRLSYELKHGYEGFELVEVLGFCYISQISSSQMRNQCLKTWSDPIKTKGIIFEGLRNQFFMVAFGNLSSRRNLIDYFIPQLSTNCLTISHWTPIQNHHVSKILQENKNLYQHSQNQTHIIVNFSPTLQLNFACLHRDTITHRQIFEVFPTAPHQKIEASFSHAINSRIIQRRQILRENLASFITYLGIDWIRQCSLRQRRVRLSPPDSRDIGHSFEIQAFCVQKVYVMNMFIFHFLTNESDFLIRDLYIDSGQYESSQRISLYA